MKLFYDVKTSNDFRAVDESTSAAWKQVLAH